MSVAKCPHCNIELIEDEAYDLNVYLLEAREYVCGHCENCGKEFQWVNKYVYSEFYGLEEM